MSSNSGDAVCAGHKFTTTQWSVVLQAIQSDPEKAAAALERLCQRYWRPVYAFVRGLGHDPHEAEDLAQGFFHFILARQALQRVDPAKGRFRSFLLAALTNFLHNEHDKGRTQRRGGRTKIVSIEELLPDEVCGHELAGRQTPEQRFDRSWAAMLVQRVLDQLREEHEQRGRARVFDSLQPFLTGEPVGADFDRLAGQLAMESGAVKVALHRARRRFGELLRREVANTVSAPDEIEAEIRDLMSALAGE